MVMFKFKFKNKNISLDVVECRSVFSRARGLMFRRKSKPLLFIFGKSVDQSIHSFFCKPFFAIWFNKNKIIEKRLVKSWGISVKPKEKFDKLLEIPVDGIKYFE